MRRSLIGNVLVTLCVIWVAAAYAHGQMARASVNRAASRAASTRLGRLGGTFTRQQGTVRSLGGSSRGGLSRPNYLGAAPGLTRLAPAPVPQAFTFGRTGYAAMRGGSAFSWEGRYNPDRLSYASGFSATVDLAAPLTDAVPFRAYVSNQPYYAPEPEGTAFHRFFQLKPTEAKAPSVTAPVDGFVGILRRENDRFAENTLARGLAAFKRATSDDVEDRPEELAKAKRLLMSARDLDSESYVSSVLLIHVALARSQTSLALRHLTDAVQRQPALFVEEFDVGSYFGDRAMLESQMRAYRRVGGGSTDEAAAFALRAYCAWVLDDRATAKASLEQMRTDSAEAGNSGELDAVRYALLAALD